MGAWRHLVALIAVVGLARGAVSAVGASSRQDRAVFRTETDLVVVTATVLDRDGRAVTNLTRSDFALRENDVPQTISLFTLDDRTPVSLVVLVDTSGSMADKLDDVQDALRHLLTQLKPDDEAALLTFSDGVRRVSEFGASRDSIRRAIDRLPARGGTALYDAVLDGIEALAGAHHQKKALLVVTDGNDTASRSQLRDVIAGVAGAEALVYCLGIGHGARGSFGHDPDSVNIGALREIAEPSGGRADLLQEAHRGGVDLVDRAVESVARELGQQYTIGYYPTNAVKDGTLRRISLTTTDSRRTVRARKVYRAPGAPAVGVID